MDQESFTQLHDVECERRVNGIKLAVYGTIGLYTVCDPVCYWSLI